MIIIHENLEKEAKSIAKALKSVYKIPVEVCSRTTDEFFIPMHGMNGISADSLDNIRDFAKNRAIFAITNKDLYFSENEDEWAWGCNEDGLSIISTARLKREDDNPSDSLEVPENKYLKRLETVAINLAGQDFISPRAMHFVDFKGVYLEKFGQESYTEKLGSNCPDDKCIMYQNTDIKNPLHQNSYMLVGDEIRYNGGLDENIEKMYPDLFCKSCRDSIRTPEIYIK